MPIGGTYVNVTNTIEENLSEFEIIPSMRFNLDSVNYINKKSALVGLVIDYKITNSYTNDLSKEVSYIMPFQGQVEESSGFKEYGNISFSLNINNGLRIKRPNIKLGSIDLSSSGVSDARYTENETILRTLSASLPLNVPARTKVEITYYFKTYYVNIDYEANISYDKATSVNHRSTKIYGRWSGNLHFDDKTIEPTIVLTNLDTKKVKMIRPNIQKTSKLNPLRLKL